MVCWHIASEASRKYSMLAHNISSDIHNKRIFGREPYVYDHIKALKKFMLWFYRL
jgi:hypothetical protein